MKEITDLEFASVAAHMAAASLHLRKHEIVLAYERLGVAIELFEEAGKQKVDAPGHFGNPGKCPVCDDPKV